MNADLAPGDRRTRAKANRLGLHVSMPLGCYHPRTSSPFIIILANIKFFLARETLFRGTGLLLWQDLTLSWRD